MHFCRQLFFRLKRQFSLKLAQNILRSFMQSNTQTLKDVDGLKPLMFPMNAYSGIITTKVTDSECVTFTTAQEDFEYLTLDVLYTALVRVDKSCFINPTF